MLGAFEEWSCAEEEVSLAPGDTLLLYSDGVTEAANAAGDEFGEDRLVRTLRQSNASTAEDLVRRIVNAVSTFSEASLVDDITVVAIRGIQ
jgi:sigma-B regulation protein RsbU (phosphoserine phosphatase)